MKELGEIIKENYSLENIEDIEKNDPMYKAVEYLYMNL